MSCPCTSCEDRRTAQQGSRAEELAWYDADRATAIAAITSTGAATMSLDQAARLLPEHPEWRRYASRRIRRAKGGR